MNLKKMGKKQLEEYKKETRGKIHSAEEELNRIDKEYTRRVTRGLSLADEARANDKRSQDRRMCDFWGCENKTKWRFLLRIGELLITVFVCNEHAKTLYEGRYSVVGSMSREKEGW